MTALDEMAKSIERALDECSVSDVLTVITGMFVGLSEEFVRSQGYDASETITIDGGDQRDITIHAKKGGAACN